LFESDLDIVCLCETWLLDSVTDSEVCTYGQYQIYRKDRDVVLTGNKLEKTGGGVMVMVKNIYFSVKLKEMETDDENIRIKILVNRNRWLYLCFVFFST
jgi:hypothetical protein